jgi:amino acid adenylation domain-containing protein
VAREDQPGEKRLVAYIVAASESGEAAVGAADGESLSRELRAYLKQRLPEYMVPTAFVELAEMPLTANGKVDRRALPASEHSRSETEEYVPPRTAAEQTLARIWSEILRLNEVGIHDNFFELGGHSLLATQVISRIRQVFELELPLRTLFEHPTVAGLAECLGGEQVGEGGLAAPGLVRRERGEKLPLSYAQQRLWFLDQLEPGSTVYNIPLALHVAGRLDKGALEQSLSEVVRRHEVLRTRFESREGEANQVIGEAEAVSIGVTDLTELAAGEQEREVRELAGAEANEPFKLERGPLLRVKLLRLGAEEHVLLVTMHHIISDGWSMGVLTREVSALYEAYLEGRESPLAELEIQYGDYAVWQREWLQGEVLEQQLGYWREQMAGAPTVLELPVDRARGAVQSYGGAYEGIRLKPRLTEEVKRISQGAGVTLFMSLLAVFQVLLWRYTGESDVVVGTPIANRTRAETEGLIGFFVNTLALRSRLDGGLNWQQVLQLVREVCLGGYGHQDVPFEKLVDELQPQRNMSHTPLFQVMLVLQNATGEEQEELRGLRLSEIGSETKTAKFDLTLILDEAGESLSGAIEYNTDLFDGATIRRVAGHYERLLESLVSNSGQLLREVQMLSEAEREQILREWNQTTRRYPQEMCLHQLFAAQVERTPEAIAVSFGERELSYGELNRRANQLAHYLQPRGVGPETLVGICLERSVEMVVALLGVLKAGGAYLPLDPEYPAARLSFMFEDAHLGLLLTQQALLPIIPPHQAEVVLMDEEWTGIAQESGGAAVSQVRAENAAYVIYTSGSTGIPKAAINTHQAICNRLLWMQEAYELTATDCVMQKTPFSFDVSVWEFFWPLMAGARLAVARPGGHREVSYLVELIRKQVVTTMHFVPSMLEQFVSDADVEQCRSLRRVVSSGEALSGELVKRFKQRLGWVELENLYGPTEAAVDVSARRCEAEEGGEGVPIGRPIANVQLYILDEEMEAVAIGVEGEIHIGGVAVGRGYLERAEQTAERYVPDPYAEDGGRRMYRTGDMGRYRADGEVEYVGRRDEQVKVRGYRIELGEVETVLREHSGVREAVVVVREDVAGDKRLVAYVVAAGLAEVGELRQYVKQRLPEYMVPSAFVQLEKLPLTPSGKVNRRALPAPERTGLETLYVAPRTEVEEALAFIWADILGMEKVSIYDNFFELGGHSLLSTQLIARVRKTFEVNVPLRSLFEMPTIAELALVVEEIVIEEIERLDDDEAHGGIEKTEPVLD